jgi:hypothetical protein
MAMPQQIPAVRDRRYKPRCQFFHSFHRGFRFLPQQEANHSDCESSGSRRPQATKISSLRKPAAFE